MEKIMEEPHVGKIIPGNVERSGSTKRRRLDEEPAVVVSALTVFKSNRSGGGIHATDGRHPLEIFPPEVWGCIIEKIKDPTDVMNFSRASNVWRNLLKPQRTQFLFHEVIPLIAGNLDAEDILKCRQVSRAWVNGTDRYLRTNENHYSLNTDRYDRCISFFRPWFSASLPEEVNSYQEKQFSKSPFIARSIGFEDTIQDENVSREFWNNIKNLLQLYGNEIWYCDLELATTVRRRRTVYESACNILRLMPNLKALQIAVLSWKEEVCFPILQHLIALRCIGLPSKHVNTLLAANPHVKKVMVEKPHNTCINSVIQFNLLENVEELSGSSISNAELQQFNLVNWPLEKLFIRLNNNKENFNLDTVFTILKRFDSTLRGLRIEFFDGGNISPMVIPRNFQLHLTKLEELFLRLENFTTLDFILPLVTLERLTIIIKEPVPHQQSADEIIQFVDYLDRMKESNIWELFPRLKNIAFNICQSNCVVSVDPDKPEQRMYCLYSRDGVKQVGYSGWMYELHKM